jgi:hypothetical protein
MKNFKLLTGIVLMMISMIIWASCARDCPSCPSCPGQSGEHIFYVAGEITAGVSAVKAFSVEQSKFVDSFTIDLQARDMAFLGSGKLMLVSAPDGARIYNLLDRNITLSTSDYGGFIDIAPNRKYFATAAKSPYGALQIYSVAGIELRHTDSVPGGFGHFSFDSENYLYSRYPGNIISYDISGDTYYSSFSVTRNAQPLYVYKVWPTVDMKKLFFIAGQGMTLYLGVTDFGKDSVRILRSPLNTGGEDGAISPDGKYFYFCNMPYADYEMPSRKVFVYDAGTEACIAEISTPSYEAEKMALSSDGKYLMLMSDGLHNYMSILLVNARSMAVIGEYAFIPQVQVLAICAGN